MPWLRSSAKKKVQTNVFCCCLIVNYGVALHRTCYKIVCIVPWCLAVYKTSTTWLCLWLGTFKSHKIGMGFFEELIFGPGDFWGFAGSPRDFFGSWLLVPFDHTCHFKSWVPPGASPHYVFIILWPGDCFLKVPINKLTSVFYASILLLIMNFVITLSK